MHGYLYCAQRNQRSTNNVSTICAFYCHAPYCRKKLEKSKFNFFKVNRRE